MGLRATIREGIRRLGPGYHGPRELSDLEYEWVAPEARFSPWNLDAAFRRTFQAIKEHTLVDKYRCFELWQLVEQSKKLSGHLLEVGVWRGGSGVLMAAQAKRCGIQEQVILCDTFAGLVNVGPQDEGLYRGGEYAAPKQAAEQLARGLGLDNVRLLEGVFPQASAHAIAELTFRLCHIDVDVYQSAKDTLEWVWPRLAVGGVVVYDDYGFGCIGVRKHVEEQRMAADRVVLHNLNGHAIMVKTR